MVRASAFAVGRAWCYSLKDFKKLYLPLYCLAFSTKGIVWKKAGYAKVGHTCRTKETKTIEAIESSRYAILSLN